MSLNVYTPKNRAQLHEAKTNKFARRNKSIHYIVGDFNPPAQRWTDLLSKGEPLNQTAPSNDWM